MNMDRSNTPINDLNIAVSGDRVHQMHRHHRVIIATPPSKNLTWIYTITKSVSKFRSFSAKSRLRIRWQPGSASNGKNESEDTKGSFKTLAVHMNRKHAEEHPGYQYSRRKPSGKKTPLLESQDTACVQPSKDHYRHRRAFSRGGRSHDKWVDEGGLGFSWRSFAISTVWICRFQAYILRSQRGSIERMVRNHWRWHLFPGSIVEWLQISSFCNNGLIQKVM